MPAPVKSKTKTKSVRKINLKTFAHFILDNYLAEFSDRSLKLSEERKIPLLKYFKGMSAETLKSLVLKSTTDLLTALAENRASEHLQASLQRWLSDQLPAIEKDQVVVEDITLVARIRKELFLHFIPKFTSDVPSIIKLIDEIDDYLLEYSSSMFKAFNNLMEERIREHVGLTEKANREFKQAQAITKIGSYDWDLATNHLTWSDELYRIYGLTPGTDLSDSEIIRPYNHPDDHSVVNKHIEHAKQTLEPFDFHYRIILNDRSEKTLHAKGEVIADKTGKAVRIIGTAQDVTKEKLLEKKLVEKQTFIQKIADATPAIIASYNVRTGRYVFINNGIKNLLGYDPQQVFDKGVEFFVALIHPDDLPQLLDKNSEAIKLANQQTGKNIQEAIVEFQYRMKHANGEYLWFHTYGTVFDRNSEHQVEHVLNISLNITERVKAEQTLLQRTVELQQSNASLEEFAFVASHDLKEPLRKIINFSDRLLTTQRSQLSDEGKEFLEKIMSSSIRMQQMISDLLSLSVIAADKTFSKVNLKKLVDEVVMTFEYKIEEVKADIQTADLPEAKVVPSQFRQLFQNLLSNSLKFSKQNVRPVIRINYGYLLPGEGASYNLHKADQYLKLEISDNGIGFDNTYVEKIFAVFQRLHSRESYEGTGIGLAICKKIVENHGGVIFATGRPHEGAVFTLIIPQ